MNQNKSIRDPRDETTWEVDESRRILEENPKGLKSFWNERYCETYSEVLEDIAEFGRHGAIYEYIIRLVKSGKILDIGCGTGILAEIINKEKFNYEGIDVSSEAIEIAKQLREGPSVFFQLTAFDDFQSSYRYDAIILNEVIYYLNYKRVLKKLKSLLVDDGYIIVSIFDFKEGLLILEKLKKDLAVFSQISILNPEKNFKWHIAAFKFD